MLLVGKSKAFKFEELGLRYPDPPITVEPKEIDEAPILRITPP